MRMLETIAEITTFLTQDVSHILGEQDESRSGLPDGTFSYQKSLFRFILEGLAMEDVVKCYVNLVYFTAIWYIL
jgi:hypothetical protein